MSKLKGKAKQRARAKARSKQEALDYVRKLQEHNLFPKNTHSVHMQQMDASGEVKPFFCTLEWIDSVSRYSPNTDTMLGNPTQSFVTSAKMSAIAKSLSKQARLHRDKKIQGSSNPTQALIGYYSDDDFMAFCRADDMTDDEWNEKVSQAKGYYYRGSSDNQSLRDKLIKMCEPNRGETKTFTIQGQEITNCDTTRIDKDLGERVIDFCEKAYTEKKLSAHEIFTACWQGFNGLYQALTICTQLSERGHSEFDTVTKEHSSLMIRKFDKQPATN